MSPSSVGEGMMLTLFQVVEQQSRALQALVGKVDSITQKTLELTDRIRDLKYPSRHPDAHAQRNVRWSVRRRDATSARAKP
jgi:cell division protein FtsB